LNGNKKVFLDEKGFLGPIGDDLPSLIPLLFALVIFFSTFTFAFNVWSERNREFDWDVAVLGVSSTMKSDSYISGVEEWESLCEKVQSTKGIKFYALLVEAELPEEDAEAFDLFAPEGIEGFEICSNTVEDDFPQIGTGINPIPRIYPVALEISEGNKFYVKPVLLVVVAWVD